MFLEALLHTRAFADICDVYSIKQEDTDFFFFKANKRKFCKNVNKTQNLKKEKSNNVQ